LSIAGSHRPDAPAPDAIAPCVIAPCAIVMAHGYAIVALSGELDIAALPALHGAFADAIRRTRVGVIVDLSRVSFIDASTLGALVGAANRAGQLPGGLKLSGIPGHVDKLIRIAGLSGRFPEVTSTSPVRYAAPDGQNFGSAGQPARTGVLPAPREAVDVVAQRPVPGLARMSR
jgi:anti-sigma B factor antagonist